MQNKKSLALREKLGLSFGEIAQKLNITPQRLTGRLKDESGISLKLALEMETQLGVSHQFFLDPYPTCAQFLGDKK